MSNENDSVFSILSKINVEQDIKQKNGMRYLPWAAAIKHLLAHFPEATWQVTKYNGVPYVQTDKGCFVEVSVNVNGIIRTQIHPVFDYRNKAIINPDSMEINKSIQRALSKAIALHGLGLYVFDGEDLPFNESEALNHAKETLSELLRRKNMLNDKSIAYMNKLSLDEINDKINKLQKDH